jgi:Tfp pilus assembly protein PilF
LPSSSVFPLTEMSNEHRVFLPYIGLACAAAWMVITEARKRIDTHPQRAYHVGRRTLVAVGAVVVIVSAGSHVRNRVWRTEKSFWSDVVDKSPRNARAVMNLGSIYLVEGDYAGAKQHIERAHAMAPNYAILEINLGLVNGRLGDSTAAEQHYRRALDLQPNSAETHYYYALWLTERGKSPEALGHLQTAIDMSPATIDSRELLMNLHFASGNDPALDELVTATLSIAPADPTASAYRSGRVPIAVTPSNADGYFVRGLVFTSEGNHANAAVAYRQAAKLAPENPDIQNNLGWARAKLGFHEQAAITFEHALRLRPDFPLAANNLAWVRSQLAKRQ